MQVGTRALVGISTLLLATLAGSPGETAAQEPTNGELLALRGRGIKSLSTNRFFLLGRKAQPSTTWEKLPDAPQIDYKTRDSSNGRVIILRCTSSCTAESGVKIGMAEKEVERSYGSPKRRERLGDRTTEIFLLYDGIGFSVSNGPLPKVTGIYVFPYL